VPKFGRSSVERNRLKRQLREIVRTRVLGNLPALDVVIRIRPSTYDVEFSVLVDELAESSRVAQELAL
jgi:ribonuclease P protein component